MLPALRAQDNYINAIGIRGGPLVAASYKHFIGVPSVIEGLVGMNFTNDRLITFTGLYEHHFFITYHLNWYAGGGLTLAFDNNDFRFGVDAIVGIEYTMPEFPLNISFDYKPLYDLLDQKTQLNEFGISARYILSR